MPNVGDQGDVLRALGRTLDEDGEGRVRILHQGQFISVTREEAKPGTQQQAYQEHELEDLRAQARTLRKGEAGPGPHMEDPGASRAELLRTLGQELDRDLVEMSSITEEEDGFRVTGTMEGKYFRELYITSDLLDLGAERRARRSAEPQVLEDLSPARDVQSGAQVVTSDGQRVGKVKEVQTRYFKVSGGMLQRDFWLPLDCVSSGDPERVDLKVTKAEAEGLKSRDVPMTA